MSNAQVRRKRAHSVVNFTARREKECLGSRNLDMAYWRYQQERLFYYKALLYRYSPVSSQLICCPAPDQDVEASLHIEDPIWRDPVQPFTACERTPGVICELPAFVEVPTLSIQFSVPE